MTLLSLYPPASAECPLEGLYLALDLQQQVTGGEVLIYANYISSLDGRIALTLDEQRGAEVPADIINTRDWRLYQELAAQSDVMITSARYFRQLERGEAQDILPVGSEPDYADLRRWRKKRGLKDQPDLLIVSRSLDIPVAALARFRDRRIMICTGSGTDPSKVAVLEQAGAELFIMQQPDVGGAGIKSLLISQAYRTAYMISGPELFRTLLAERVVDYLFLTTRLRLIGGDHFDTILSGDIGGCIDMQLQSLYLDRNQPTAQLFASYRLQPA